MSRFFPRSAEALLPPHECGGCHRPQKHLTDRLTLRFARRTFNHMVKSNAARLDSVFHALSDSTRRSILRDITAREKTVGEIAKPYRISLAAVSKHLKVLESAELIARERRGSFQIVRLNPAPLRPAEEWLAYYQKFWERQLDALQHFLEGEEDERARSSARARNP
jgi:DNA-binding transcriptional ArsR family regulator